jgi:hypothetical protein
VTKEVAGKPNARVAVGIRKPEFLEWYVGRMGK